VVLVALLSPKIGVGPATAVALVSRILTTVGDLVTASAASGYSWWWRRSRGNQDEVAEDTHQSLPVAQSGRAPSDLCLPSVPSRDDSA